MGERLCWVTEAVSTGRCTATGFFSTREEGLAAARESLSNFQSGIVEHLQEEDPDTSEEELRKMLGDSTWEPWEEVVSEGEDVTFFISRDFMRGFNYMIVRPVTEDEMVCRIGEFDSDPSLDRLEFLVNVAPYMNQEVDDEA